MDTVVDNELVQRLNKFCDEHGEFYTVNNNDDFVWDKDQHEWWTKWLEATEKAEELQKEVGALMGSQEFLDFLNDKVGSCEFGDHPFVVIEMCEEWLKDNN